MRLLAQIRHDSITNTSGRVLERKASRAIVLDGTNILLLYTKRYDDYSFPGGGLDDNEDLIAGLKRELFEETGVVNINVLQEFGYVDEYRPHFKPEYNIIHMLSYFFVCDTEKHLGQGKMEDYEISNGMEARWVNINDAIKHNRNVITSKQSSMGLSIERETMILEMVLKELVRS